MNSNNVNNLATASLLQAPVSLWPQNSSGAYTPSQSLIPNVSGLVAGDAAGVCIGGLQVVNGQLIGTLWDFYDTTGTTTVTHFRMDSLDLSTATVEGMFQVGTNGLNAGFYDGYMCPIPAAWQSALGAPYITGSVTQNIVSRTSNGPGAFGFNPSSLSTSTPSTTIPYVYYPGTNPLGGGSYTTTSLLWNGLTYVSGAFFAPGSSTVLFFGSTGTNTMMYGTQSAANDPNRPGKGPHSVNGDYTSQVMAYNANDFLAVEDGKMQPWQLQPYAIWNLDFPIDGGGSGIGGVTFDPSTNRLYVVGSYADPQSNGLPLIEVYQLTSSTSSSGSSGTSVQTVKTLPAVDTVAGTARESQCNGYLARIAIACRRYGEQCRSEPEHLDCSLVGDPIEFE